ncbi:MAG: sigma-70 family RNA polymerase sigma factor [Clostridia bacterium]|nr:sigma-70 family RNA polymerase sigma factor [Clostridia bacterium]
MTTQKFNHLLQKSKTDKRAWEEIHKEYYPILIYHLNRRFGNLISAEDIAQDVFVSLIPMENFGYIEAPEIWLRKVANFKAIDSIKYRHEEEPIPEDYPVPVRFDQLDLTEDVKKSLSYVDKQTREMIYLHFWEGYTETEIAKIMHMNPVTVRVRIYRAYLKIKKYY